MMLTNKTNKKLKITLFSYTQGSGDPYTGSFELNPNESSGDTIKEFNPHSIDIEIAKGKRGRPVKI